jgi:uncharacterized protein with NRDE domain
MCLIAFACGVHPDHPLLMVANRDEFHARTALPLAWWEDRPRVLAGRDVQEGGTWLGLSRSGRAAAVTNVRGPDAADRRPLSRGALVADFLDGSLSAEAFAEQLESRSQDFGGFNLLLFDDRELRYVSNRPAFVSRPVPPGVHALSNARLDTPWPKAEAARMAMQDWIARDLADEAALLAHMADRTPAPDEQLPHTGVGADMERALSSAFIALPAYGTRCTSLLRVSADGSASLFERRYDRRGAVENDSRETFTLSASPA